MGIMQKTHSFYESLVTLLFSVIREFLLFVICCFVEMLCAKFDDGAPRVPFFSFLPPGFQQVTLFEVIRYNIIPTTLNSVHQHCACNQQEQTQEAAWVSNHWTSLRNVQENKGARRCRSIDEILCCLAILHIVV